MSTTKSTTLDRITNKTTLDTISVSAVVRQSRSSDDTMSIEDQIARIEAACEREGYSLSEVHVEQDVSGGRALSKRPGLTKAVRDVESGRSQILMVAYFDRLVRSLTTQREVTDRVEEAGGRVLALDVGEVSNGSAAKWLSSQMLGMMSEYYRLSVGERTADAKQRNIDKGVPPFPRITPAYVRRADGTLETHPVHAPLIREAIKMRTARTPASYVQITRWLNEQGLKISSSGVESMLSSKLLIGEIHFGKFTPNTNAGKQWGGTICDRATFRKMHSKRAARGRYGKSERLLARQDVLVCETCDARLTVSSVKSNGKSYAYYRCGNALCTRQAIVACDVAERVVAERAIEIAIELRAAGSATSDSEIEQARVERDAAETKLANAIKTLIGLDSETATREVLDELTAEREAAVDRHERLLAFTTPDLTVTAADWDSLLLDAQREVIRILVDRAVVTPGRGAGRVHVIERSA